jgi:predicted metal-binding membrane protein
VYLFAAWAGDLAMDHATATRAVAIATLAICGVYQLTPLKQRCLVRCRSPFAHLLRYSSFRGRTRDLRAGVHHGGFCLACCWALMALLVVFGVMNVVAMVGLTAVVLIEKVWRFGPAFARLCGGAALALAGVVWWVPGIAAGLVLPTGLT